MDAPERNSEKEFSPKSHQKKPGSHNKREMVDPPLLSLSALYPTGTQIFLPRSGKGKGKYEAKAQAISGGSGKGGDVTTPARTVLKYREKFDAHLAAAGIPPSGTPSDFSPMFPDSPACSKALNFASSQ